MDPRLQGRSPNQARPAYPQTTDLASTPSASSSAFQSSSSLASLSSATTRTSNRLVFDMPSALQAQSFAAAPMPSPTAGPPRDGYFSSLAPAQTSPSQPPSSLMQMSSDAQPSQNAPSPRGQYAFMGSRGDGHGAPANAAYSQDFSLLAEAAKRAQMAVLTRDLGDIGL